MSEKRYLLFNHDYDEEFIGEIKRLKGAGKHGNLIRVIEKSKPLYKYTLEEINRTPIEGQGEHVVMAWVDADNNTIAIDHEFDEYEYGEPVPEGMTMRFDGYQYRIMTFAEAAEIEEAVQRAISSAERIIYYPSGATGKVMQATGI